MGVHAVPAPGFLSRTHAPTCQLTPLRQKLQVSFVPSNESVHLKKAMVETLKKCLQSEYLCKNFVFDETALFGFDFCGLNICFKICNGIRARVSCEPHQDRIWNAVEPTSCELTPALTFPRYAKARGASRIKKSNRPERRDISVNLTVALLIHLTHSYLNVTFFKWTIQWIENCKKFHDKLNFWFI